MPTAYGWTSIPVLYRDASNYKAYGSILLEGNITDDEIAALRACLIGGTLYVPGQLGLPHLAVDAWPGSAYDDDHNWHEMLLDEISTATQAFEPLARETSAHRAGTVSDFLTRARGAAAAGWNPGIGNPW